MGTVYIFQGDIYCESCGEDIREGIRRSNGGRPPAIQDSESYPMPHDAGNTESDTPHHCGGGDTCLEPETLDNGETVPCLVTSSLTDDGVEYVRDAHLNNPTDLTAWWVDRFGVDWRELDDFVTGFLECALWATSAEGPGNDGQPVGNLDDFLDIDDLCPETIRKAREDCDAFRESAGILLDDIDESQAGHDFFLTREGHGAGFWDRDHPGDIGDRLSDLCRPFGDFDFEERWAEYGEGVAN